MLIRIKN